MMQSPMLCCIELMLTLATTPQNTRIDSDPIPSVLCVVFLCLVTKNCKFMNIFMLSKLNTTQRMLPCIIL